MVAFNAIAAAVSAVATVVAKKHEFSHFGHFYRSFFSDGKIMAKKMVEDNYQTDAGPKIESRNGIPTL